VVNADDFGFTSGVNRAIVKAHTDGIVTSATLMANGPAFCEVMELAEQFPKLSIGCHAVLIDGEPVLPAASVLSLTQSGRFRADLKTFAARALTGQLDALRLAPRQRRKSEECRRRECACHTSTRTSTPIFSLECCALSIFGRSRVRGASRPESVRPAPSLAIE
jgi:YdjC-like protein